MDWPRSPTCSLRGCIEEALTKICWRYFGWSRTRVLYTSYNSLLVHIQYYLWSVIAVCAPCEPNTTRAFVGSNSQQKTGVMPGTIAAAKVELDELTSCRRLSRHRLSLCFKSTAIENAYLAEVASSRRPVFIATATFDVFILVLRLSIRAVSSTEWDITGLVSSLVLGVSHLVFLYSLIALIHWRSKKSGFAAIQSEVLLAALISGLLCLFCSSSTSSNSWIFLAFFLICCTTILRLRWFVGAFFFSLPLLLTMHNNVKVTFDSSMNTGLHAFLHSMTFVSTGPLPIQTVVHLIVAWAAGILMGYLADDSRRDSFANHRLALAAAAAELAEVRARVVAEKELSAAQALAKAKSLLIDRERASNEAKGEFISMLCHEIRTPLNGCLASAEMLLQTSLDEDQTDLAHTIRISGSILLSTVSNFLDFSKLEAGKPLDIIRAPLDLGTLVSDVHRIIEAMVAAGGDVTLHHPHLHEGIPPTLIGDPNRICGILLNMYMNAAKYTQRGSIGLEVKIVDEWYAPGPPLHRSPPHDVGSVDYSLITTNSSSSYTVLQSPTSSSSVQKMTLQDEGDGWMSTASTPHTLPRTSTDTTTDQVVWVCFEVVDTGSGIAPKSLAALFHEYVQGDEDEMEKPRTRSGTGLGLAICGKQIAVLGGVIGALSKPGVGSVFWFKVPMLVDQQKPNTPSTLATFLSSCDCTSSPTSYRQKNVGGKGVGMKRVGSEGLLDPRQLEESWNNHHGSVASSGCSSSKNSGRNNNKNYNGGDTGSVEDVARGDVDDGSDGDSAPEEEDALQPLQGLHGLVVEDNMINQKVACRVLQSIGISCDVASNGQEAVDKIQMKTFDFVLMDMCMPIMIGVEATRIIRENLGLKELPIIAMTANALDKDKNECIEAGMNGFLSKPMLRDQLVTTITTVVMVGQKKTR